MHLIENRAILMVSSKGSSPPGRKIPQVGSPMYEAFIYELLTAELIVLGVLTEFRKVTNSFVRTEQLGSH